MRAGMCFLATNGEEETQGMLQVRLQDRHSSRQYVVATMHLKAKSGTQNDAIRQRQVR